MTLRYKITPQMREYDFLGASEWLPFLMYFHPSNFISSVVNTDEHGFRFAVKSGKKIGNFNDTGIKNTSLVIGGSTVFGVGSTNDSQTIPSLLNESCSDSVWLNFGGRAFTSTQELLLLLFYSPRIKKIDKIVIFSGVNDLSIYYSSPVYSKDIGSFFHCSKYREAMNSYSLSLKRMLVEWLVKCLVSNSNLLDLRKLRKNELIDLLLRKRNIGDLEDRYRLKNLKLDHDLNKNDLLYTIERNYSQIATLAKSYGAKVYFILQPCANWTTKKFSQEEEMLFKELDNCPENHWKILKEKMSLAQYDWYKNALKEICNNNKIPFFDANQVLSNKQYDNKWFFVDRVHLTDEGNSVMANFIQNEVLQ